MGQRPGLGVRAGVRVAQLEVALRRARQLDDQRQGLLEERLDLLLLTELEQAQIEVPLAAQRGRVRIVRGLRHVSSS